MSDGSPHEQDEHQLGVVTLPVRHQMSFFSNKDNTKKIQTGCMGGEEG